MSDSVSRLSLWAPRFLGLLVTGFLSLFALDAFGEGGGLGDTLLGFVIHLIPAWILLATVVFAWRRPWIGGVVFTGLAVAYALTTLNRPDWILVIAGPLLVVGVLYLWSWRRFSSPPLGSGADRR
jgi:hypothetical protein